MALQTVLKNIFSFLEILSSSCSASAASWDAQSLRNAFEWAAYCEQIYIQSKGKPYSTDLDLEIRKIGALSWTQKHSVTVVSLGMLEHCSQLLIANLLQNLHLQPEMLASLSTDCQASVLCFEKFTKLVNLKATSELLRVLHKDLCENDYRDLGHGSSLRTSVLLANSLSSDSSHSDVLANCDDPAVWCSAQLLLQHISAAMRDGDAEKTERLKIVLMKKFEEADVCQIILAASYALVATSLSSPLNLSVKKLLEECLKSIIRIDESFFMKIPSGILICICNQYFEFYRDYVGYLIKSCENLKPVYGSHGSHVVKVNELVSWRQATAVDRSVELLHGGYDELKTCFSDLLRSGSSRVVSATKQILIFFEKRHEVSVWSTLIGDLNL